jgi:hypothetical protein
VFEYCAREAAQIFGGASYVRGGQGEKVERLYREVRAYAIPGGRCAWQPARARTPATARAACTAPRLGAPLARSQTRRAASSRVTQQLADSSFAAPPRSEEIMLDLAVRQARAPLQRRCAWLPRSLTEPLSQRLADCCFPGETRAQAMKDAKLAKL